MILPKSCTPFLYNIMASGPLLNVEQDSYCILVQVSGSWWLKKLGRTGGKPVHGVLLFYASQLLIPTFLYLMKIEQ